MSKRTYEALMGAMTKVIDGLGELNQMRLMVTNGEGTGSLVVRPFEADDDEVLAVLSNNYCRINPGNIMKAVADGD